MNQIVLEPEPKTFRGWSWSPKFEFRLTALLSPGVGDIKLLGVHEFSFMGTEEDISLLHSGFFLQLMEFSFKKDEKFVKISRSIPNNEK